MNYEVEFWPIEKLASERVRLLLSPRYQRGEAWAENKQSLLIDTILMGYDVPKLYFSANKAPALHNYDVVDGQQRLLSIYRFLGLELNGNGQPLTLKRKDGLEWQEGNTLIFADLNKQQKEQFLSYKVTVTIVKDASNDQLRRLFLRLQMGSILNQAELRNALSSVNGDNINALVENHPFFAKTAIPMGRYKRQDYLAQAVVHARAVESGEFGAVDAAATKMMYLEDPPLLQSFWARVYKTLDAMAQITEHDPRAFYNKWMFVDFFALFWVLKTKLSTKAAGAIATQIREFENVRIAVRKEPESLVGKRGMEPKLLLGYVDSFYKDGGLTRSLEKRFKFLSSQKENLMIP